MVWHSAWLYVFYIIPMLALLSKIPILSMLVNQNSLPSFSQINCSAPIMWHSAWLLCYIIPMLAPMSRPHVTLLTPMSPLDPHHHDNPRSDLISQSQGSIQVTWPVLTNQGPVFGSRDSGAGCSNLQSFPAMTILTIFTCWHKSFIAIREQRGCERNTWEFGYFDLTHRQTGHYSLFLWHDWHVHDFK